MLSHKIVSISVVILLITVLFAGVVTVPAAAQNDAVQAAAPQKPGWKFRADLQNTGVYDDGGVRPESYPKWTFDIGIPPFETPSSSAAVANGVVYIGSTNGNVYAINATSGSELWSYKTGGEVRSTPAVADGVVYVGSYDRNVYAINATTGTLKWSFATKSWVDSSPSIANGVVYVSGGPLYALNAASGSVLWNTTDGDYGSVAVANGVLFGSYNRHIVALSAGTGEWLWYYATKGYIYSRPAVANGVVYVGSSFPEKNVYALDATTGTQLWNYTTGASVDSSPAVANGVVYVGSNDNKLYALDAASGTLKWSFATAGYVDSSPAVANGVVYVSDKRGQLYAVGQKEPISVAKVDPPDGAVDVPVTKVINVTFNRPVTVSLSKIKLLEGNTPVSPSLFNMFQYSTELTITPTKALKNNVTYTISIEKGAAETQDPYERVALATNFTSNFTTIEGQTIPAQLSIASNRTVVVANQSFTLFGKLNTTNGAPIANVTVQLQRNVSGIWTNVTGENATTDANGTLNITHLRYEELGLHKSRLFIKDGASGNIGPVKWKGGALLSDELAQLVLATNNLNFKVSYLSAVPLQSQDPTLNSLKKSYDILNMLSNILISKDETMAAAIRNMR